MDYLNYLFDKHNASYCVQTIEDSMALYIMNITLQSMTTLQVIF